MTAAAAGSAGGGIAFDTDNEGDWLFVQANDATGALFGYAIDLRDVSGAPGGIRIKTFNGLSLEANDTAGLLSHNGRVVIESDETTVYPAEAIFVTAPTGTVNVTADGVTVDANGSAGLLTMDPSGNVALAGNASLGLGSGGDIDVSLVGDLTITGLPTVNPGGTGRVWNDSGTLKIT